MKSNRNECHYGNGARLANWLICASCQFGLFIYSHCCSFHLIACENWTFHAFDIKSVACIAAIYNRFVIQWPEHYCNQRLTISLMYYSFILINKLVLKVNLEMLMKMNGNSRDSKWWRNSCGCAWWRRAFRRGCEIRRRQCRIRLCRGRDRLGRSWWTFRCLSTPVGARRHRHTTPQSMTLPTSRRPSLLLSWRPCQLNQSNTIFHS